MASDSGTIERREEAERPDELVRLWFAAIDLAGRTEKDWRESADKTIKTFNGDAGPGSRFNILQSNTATLAAALYNSTPTPDIRQRNDVAPPEMPPELQQAQPAQAPQDPAAAAMQQQAVAAYQQAVAETKQTNGDAKTIGQALERTITAQHDRYGFDQCMHKAVQDQLLPGRGVTRVRYVPIMDGETIVDEQAPCEHVQWDAIRIGPAKCWEDVTWVAFQLFLTREQLEKLNPEIGAKISLESVVEGAREGNDGKQVPSLMKRAEVWEIWDRDTGKVLFVARSWPDGPLVHDDDPLELEGFFPIPRPLYSIPRSWTLIPKPEFDLYREQARELDQITARLGALVRAAKWRGVYDGKLAGAFATLKGLDDGEFAPSENAAQFGEHGIAKGIWTMPIGELVAVIQQLVQAREQIKGTIYEITGVSDILRGSTNASETATAQRIKAQWGSLRLQNRQAEVQRYARDLVRMQADIIASKFSPDTIRMASGVVLNERQVALMRADINRGYRVDIETDSTIRSDVEAQQKNVAEAMGALGQFMQGIGPAIQSGQIKAQHAAKLLAATLQPFKLGRAGQEAIDAIVQDSEQAAKQPKQEKPDPKAEAEKAKLGLEQSRFEFEKGRAQIEDGRENAKAQREELQANTQAERDAAKHVLEMEALQAKTRAEILKAEIDIAEAQAGQVAAQQQRGAAQVDTAAQSATIQGMAAIVQGMQQQAQQTQAFMQHMMAAMQHMMAQANAPKEVIRDARGRVAGVKPMTMQ